MQRISYALTLLLLLAISTIANGQPPVVPSNPPYPITAAYFGDRYNSTEWNETFTRFASIGGDTVVKRAPRVAIVTYKELIRDKDFKGCKENGSTHCIQESKDELEHMGLNLTFAVYKYEEDYSDKIIKCEKYEKRYTYNGTVAYRLVIPLNEHSSDSCDLSNGTAVLVIFTVFHGIDHQSILLQSASRAKPQQKVYFGLPRAPVSSKKGDIMMDYVAGYFEFVNRILVDHAYRYPVIDPDDTTLRWSPENSKFKTLNTTLEGYLIGEDQTLVAGSEEYPVLGIYMILGELVHNHSRKVIMSTTIDLTIKRGSSVNEHVMGFETLMQSNTADVISVSEGRGYGRGCYYYPSQVNDTIESVDPMLFKILKHKHPHIKKDTTFRKEFVGSNNELFAALGSSRDKLNTAGHHTDLWLNIEAFEDVPTHKCPSSDASASAMPVEASRTTKKRLDMALSAAGLYPQKVMVTSWDPAFTCKPEGFNTTLFDDIHSDVTRVIVSSCGFHSSFNMSVVLIGYNVGGYNNVTYYTREGERHSVKAFGYYFEMDWGIENSRVPSLIYTQLWDMYDAFDLSMNGTVSVLPDGAYNACEYTYDYR